MYVAHGVISIFFTFLIYCILFYFHAAKSKTWVNSNNLFFIKTSILVCAGTEVFVLVRWNVIVK